jgi:hypothetical protein
MADDIDTDNDADTKLDIDLEQLAASSVPIDMPEEFGKPDYKATKEDSKIRNLFGPKEKESPKRGRPPGTGNSIRIPRRKGQYIEPLMQLYTTLGTVVFTFDNVCGEAVIVSAENCAKSLDELAYTNDSVNRALFSLTQTSASAAVLIAHMPILMAIANHHMPIGRLGNNNASEQTEEAI